MSKYNVLLRTKSQRQRPCDSFSGWDSGDGSAEKAIEEIRRSGAGGWMETVIWCLHSTSMLLRSYLCRDYLID